MGVMGHLGSRHGRMQRLCLMRGMLTRRVAIGGVYEGLLLLIHAQQRTALIHRGRLRGWPRRHLMHPNASNQMQCG